MLLARLLRHRRVLAWSALTLTLVGLGWALDAWLPPQPRWTARGPFVPVEFSPDGATLRVVAWTGELFGDQGERAFRWIKHPAPTNGPAQVWDAATGRVLRTAPADGGMLSYEFSRDGRLLAALLTPAEGQPPELYRVDLATGEERRAALPIAMNDWRLYLSPQGNVIALLNDQSAWPERRIAVYAADTLRPIADMPTSVDWAWNPDGASVLAVARAEEGHDCEVVRIGLDGEKSRTVFKGALGWRGLTPDGRGVMTVRLPLPFDQDWCTFALWDLETAQLRAEFRVKRPWAERPTFLPDGRFLVERPEDGEADSLGFWDVQTGRFRGAIQTFRGPADAAVSPDGATIITNIVAAEEVGIALYEVPSFAQRWKRQWPSAWVTLLTNRPAGILVGIVPMGPPVGEGWAELLDPEDGQTRATFPWSGNHRSAMATMHRGKQHFLFKDEGLPHRERQGIFRNWLERWGLARPPGRFTDRVRILDAHSGREVFNRAYDEQQVSYLFADDDRTMAIMYHDAAADEMVTECWDVPAGKPLRWLGFPMALAVLLPALRFGWRRLRRSAHVPPLERALPCV